LLIVLICGCSTKKNTWATRTYQATNTRFNVFFNGTESYGDGLKAIIKANKEDYSSIIPMYPISRHENAKAAISAMDRTIEKCRKAIKLYSIKTKPKKDYKKENSPEYLLYYNQKEFNPALKDVWLMLAQAEFHKGDFLGSSATFSYVARLYAGDNDMETTCKLWIARAYGEISWIYEAEEILSKIVQNNLKHKNIGLFASVNADLLLKKHQYKEAIPFLELALSKEKDKNMKLRFNYLLAQLYQKTGDDNAAYNGYTTVIKSNPPFEMEFNARISRAQIDKGNVKGVRKDLRKMLKNSKNKDYLDQIYYALGNTYLHNADTLKAIENYKLSADTSTRKGIDKAVSLITLGDLYFNKRKYVLAQPCYDEARKIITNEYDDFARVTKRADVLGELVTQNDIVQLQDSLQRLAAMPEKKRLEVVNKLIERLIAAEKEAAKKQAEKARKASQEEDLSNVAPIGAVGDWYFYNTNLMRTGQSEFQNKWGNRKLEDNWRRTNKTAALFGEDNASDVAKNDTTGSDSIKKVSTDIKSPGFYLQQIPVTATQISKSNAEIASALFAMGLIYKDKLEELPMAISTFNEFIRRFGSDEHVPDAYYYLYMMNTKVGKQTEAELYRSKLITEFPDSKYKKILSQPDYTERIARMYRDQDSIYSLTYKAYNENNFDLVFKEVAYIQQNYPLATLMPKFLFLNALSIGKKENSDKFKKVLSDLVSTYPESDVSAMAKDILALMKQGREAQTGTTSGTLLARRDEVTKSEIDDLNSKSQFSTDRKSKHRLMLITPTDRENMNKLLYTIASFNFSRFMIKDFDLVISKLDTLQNVLSVTNFESYDETDWYSQSIDSDAVLNKMLTDFGVQKVIISEDNYALLRTSFKLNDYLAFISKQVEGKPVENTLNEATKTVKKQDPIRSVKDIISKIEQTVATKVEEKPLVKQPEKPVGKLDEKQLVKIPEKSVEKVQTSNLTPKQETTVKTSPPVTTVPTASTVVQPKEEEVPLFKNLFAYHANDPHFVAIYIVSGTFDFDKTKKAIDAYNAQNYSVMNLNVSLEKVGNQQIIIIGSLSDANVAKSYLMRMVKEKSLFEGLKGSGYRNLLGSQKNLNIMMQQNAMSTYFEFMQMYYLK